MLTPKRPEPRMVYTCYWCQGKDCETCSYSGRIWESDEEYAERLERTKRAGEEAPC